MAQSDEFIRGFTAGWMAASQAMAQGMEGAMKAGSGGNPSPAKLATAGDKPVRRRGRPPKAAASTGDQPKRPRGRPRKTAAS